MTGTKSLKGKKLAIRSGNMNANLKSIILMIIGMGCLTLCDLLIKIASQTLPLGLVMIVFGIGSITVFLGLMRTKG